MRIITSLFAPFYQTIYPHVVSIVKKPKNEANNFLKKVFKYSLGISTIVFLLSVLLGEFSLLLVFGEEAKTETKPPAGTGPAPGADGTKGGQPGLGLGGAIAQALGK